MRPQRVRMMSETRVIADQEVHLNPTPPESLPPTPEAFSPGCGFCTRPVAPIRARSPARSSRTSDIDPTPSSLAAAPTPTTEAPPLPPSARPPSAPARPDGGSSSTPTVRSTPPPTTPSPSHSGPGSLPPAPHSSAPRDTPPPASDTNTSPRSAEVAPASPPVRSSAAATLNGSAPSGGFVSHTRTRVTPMGVSSNVPFRMCGGRIVVSHATPLNSARRAGTPVWAGISKVRWVVAGNPRTASCNN